METVELREKQKDEELQRDWICNLCVDEKIEKTILKLIPGEPEYAGSVITYSGEELVDHQIKHHTESLLDCYRKTFFKINCKSGDLSYYGKGKRKSLFNLI